MSDNREYRVHTKMGTETYYAWDVIERDGILSIISTKDGNLAIFAPGEWLRVEFVGLRQEREAA